MVEKYVKPAAMFLLLLVPLGAREATLPHKEADVTQNRIIALQILVIGMMQGYFLCPGG